MLGLLALSGVNIPVAPQLIFSLLGLLLAFWIVFTLIIRYHWKNYGTGGVEVFTMNFIYLTGSGVLIVLMTVTATIYSFSTT